MLSIIVVPLAAGGISTILLPVAIMGSLGLIFGLVLAFASKVFAVNIDERIEQIIEVLPGANCGACGQPGCAGYATAIVTEDKELNLCAPGGAAVVGKIAKIMGKEASAQQRKIAYIHCSSGGKNNTKWKYDYQGIESCLSAVNIADGPNLCSWGCVGFNDCVAACKFDAISVDENGLRIIDRAKCTGCGACVNACPRRLIMLIPESRNVFITCSSKDKNPLPKQNCGTDKPCIGCGLCAKKCPAQAITVENNIARIDYSKCTDCGTCATVCPTKAIIDLKIANRT
ncbi:MAG TPA: RnfABCDGE type electron transport complex subunit B [Candidatus Cloacimonas sp.]|nr:RnfABCDGE type electron transport complex subunit B [Candidatus Cloacimonas sp.]HPV64738.1 RnfABCDGE type electron transport complex subunit B [Candidatus Cloacimonas sp.]HPZ02098.1 RnfABCDGE type electron transport complex subunit B [Candidatus Cloacimonas sp.]HQB50413.1 RnfABCDGE type electron transport complex subunit B [Candidatus Cloacimonas sp.]HQM17437.1 RnfABCDGE type electron transport complex subunit B [Candidatus Cloacimonas sp.]